MVEKSLTISLRLISRFSCSQLPSCIIFISITPISGGSQLAIGGSFLLCWISKSSSNRESISDKAIHRSELFASHPAYPPMNFITVVSPRKLFSCFADMAAPSILFISTAAWALGSAKMSLMLWEAALDKQPYILAFADNLSRLQPSQKGALSFAIMPNRPEFSTQYLTAVESLGDSICLNWWAAPINVKMSSSPKN